MKVNQPDYKERKEQNNDTYSVSGIRIQGVILKM